MEEIIKELKQLSESLYDEHQYTWSDQVDEIIEKLRAKTAEAVGHDLLVSGKFADAWQKCPKCDGQGIVSKPPYVAGDVHEWSSTSAVHTCNVCNGAKIIKR